MEPVWVLEQFEDHLRELKHLDSVELGLAEFLFRHLPLKLYNFQT